MTSSYRPRKKFRLRKIKTILLSAAVLTLAGTFTVAAAEILGDSDCNGIVTINDVTCIQKTLAELPLNDSFSENAADVDRNSRIEIKDATFIQLWLAELDASFPIGEQITETTAPSNETTTEPIETTVQQIPATTEPPETTTQPIEATTEPAETTAHQVTEPTTQPVETTAQSATDADGWGRDIFRP